MQIHEGKEIGRLGVRLSPDTQDLFAAAPALLEALKEVLGLFEWDESGGPEERAYDKARAAINKAEGV
jgi:hypothetical protein